VDVVATHREGRALGFAFVRAAWNARGFDSGRPCAAIVINPYDRRMAKRTLIQLTDDIDGSQAAETVTFALDGVEYEVDLSEKNAAKLRAGLTKFTANARRTGGKKARSTKPTTPKRGQSDSAQIREWAKAQGIEVSERGRVPADLRAQFSAATG
jgi:hypothetical protein